MSDSLRQHWGTLDVFNDEQRAILDGWAKEGAHLMAKWLDEREQQGGYAVFRTVEGWRVIG